MTIEKAYDGAIVIMDVIKGVLVTRRYYGYTKREARSMFNNEAKELS
jgi:hypothetical protein